MNRELQSTEPSFELPSPDVKLPQQDTGEQQAHTASGSEKTSSVALEQGVSDPSGFITPSGGPPPSDNTGTAVSSSSLSAIGSGSMPQIADDGDLIEKEWVEKAKEIVEKTKDDPYSQNEEINRIKADYLKKRYGKDIKLRDNA